MKKYRIREYSPAWWLGLTLGTAIPARATKIISYRITENRGDVNE